MILKLIYNKIRINKMKIHKFNSFLENAQNITEKQIEDYLKEHFTSQWFDSELSDRVFDYIGTEEAEDYDGDPVEAYKNLSTGGAVEYDLLEEMIQEVSQHFNIDREQEIENRNIVYAMII